ncbi:cobalamin biosynthesis protein CobG [Vreelandella sp. EE27]
MSRVPQIKGWCPGAWRPMATGDGLLVRVRAPQGELTRFQALALCEAADLFGSGLIELTNRANLQLRGVSEATWPPLMDFLIEHGLVSQNPDAERVPPMMLAPGGKEGDDTRRAARLLSARGHGFPALPAKVGIAVDLGPAPVLQESPADFRIERSENGALLVRCEGRARGTLAPSIEAAVELVIELSHWFVESGGREAKRMARHCAALPVWAPQNACPAGAGEKLPLGDHPLGAVVGLALGRVSARELRALVTPFTQCTLQVTPWRRLLITGAAFAQLPVLENVIVRDDDPRLLIDACPGAPYCAQASVETQALACRLTGIKAESVHISGCAKGCARKHPAAVCLVGRDGRFDLITNERADAVPAACGLDEPDVLNTLEKLGALHL